MHLPAMVSLVIEEVKNGYRCCFLVMFALIVGVEKCSLEEVIGPILKKDLYLRVLLNSRCSEFIQTFEQNGVQLGCRTASNSCKAGHPNLIAEQYVIEQAMYAAEGTATKASIFGGIELSAALIQSFVCDSVVAG